MKTSALLSDDRGTTLVETAVVLPTFFMFLFGFFGFAVALFGLMNANYAVNAATRYASVHSAAALVPATTTSTAAVVTGHLFLPSSITPTVTVTHTRSGTLIANGNSLAVGDLVTASVIWTATPIWGRINIAIPAQSSRTVTR
jgi:TadE-like protein